MKSIVFCNILLFLILSASSCKKNNDSVTTTPEITGVEPNSGVSGIEVTISGHDFPGTDTSTTSVLFNGVKAKVIQIGENEIHALVPESAGTGDITVKFPQTSISGPQFTYINSWLIEGSDMGSLFEWVSVTYEGQPVGDAIVTVNGVSLPKSTVYAEKYNGSLPEPVDPGGTLDMSVTLANGNTFNASGYVPEKPTLVSPSENSVFTKSQTLTVEWTCPVNPDRFLVNFDFNLGTANYVGMYFPASGTARSFTLDLADVPSGSLNITLSSYSDGTFSGSPLSGFSNMNIRNESSETGVTVQ